MERKELFKSLVGSHNYNLNTETSDRDYKSFILPTFDDLYTGNFYSIMKVGETEDLDVHDIRKVNHLWYKANVNFLEVLFSEDVLVNCEHAAVTEIFMMKNKIAKMNLPYLYEACIGMHHQKMKQIEKGTSGTQNLVDQFGYDTKQALHAYRILDFLCRFRATDFNDFKSAIWYDDEDTSRTFLFDVKNGKYKLEDFRKIVQVKLQLIEDLYRKAYKEQPVDTNTQETVLNIVKGIVRRNIYNE